MNVSAGNMYLLISIIASSQVQILVAQYEHSGDPQFNNDPPSNNELAANAGIEFHDDNRPFEDTFDNDLPSNDELAANAGSEFQDDNRSLENTFDEDLPSNDALAANAGSEFLDDTPYTMIPTPCPVDCKDSLVYPRSGTLVLCKDG